jgi:enoyl-CoA hydratase/carnithine racemase
MELVLGGLDLDAERAESWGYLNRALPSDEIDEYVTRLAQRIAASPASAVRVTKALMQPSAEPIERRLQEENFHLRCLLATDESRRNVAAFLAAGGETRDGELRIEELLGAVLAATSRVGS